MGGVNKRRPREQVPMDTAANKRQALEEPETFAANEIVQVEDMNVDAPPEVREHTVAAAGPGHASGTSWLSGSYSSIREKIRELITIPSFLSNLSPDIFSQYRDLIEKKEVPLSDFMTTTFARRPVTPD